MNTQATRIMYVECKATGDHRGRARICRVRFSKTGRTIYLGGLVLQSSRGSGIQGNYINAKTGIEYWVSGPKKKGGDRHWIGGGGVRIDPEVVDEYWRDIRECDPADSAIASTEPEFNPTFGTGRSAVEANPPKQIAIGDPNE